MLFASICEECGASVDIENALLYPSPTNDELSCLHYLAPCVANAIMECTVARRLCAVCTLVALMMSKLDDVSTSPGTGTGTATNRHTE